MYKTDGPIVIIITADCEAPGVLTWLLERAIELKLIIGNDLARSTLLIHENVVLKLNYGVGSAVCVGQLSLKMRSQRLNFMTEWSLSTYRAGDIVQLHANLKLVWHRF